jgi:hypothetical protein
MENDKMKSTCMITIAVSPLLMVAVLFVATMVA